METYKNLDLVVRRINDANESIAGVFDRLNAFGPAAKAADSAADSECSFRVVPLVNELDRMKRELGLALTAMRLSFGAIERKFYVVRDKYYVEVPEADATHSGSSFRLMRNPRMPTGVSLPGLFPKRTSLFLVKSASCWSCPGSRPVSASTG